MSAILETKNLGKRFGAFAANSEIDFSVQPGELRAVIGPNGAGKTTFFNLLSGIADPTEGEIYFHGEKITPSSKTAASPRSRIRRASSSSNFFGRRRATRTSIRSRAKRSNSSILPR